MLEHSQQCKREQSTALPTGGIIQMRYITNTVPVMDTIACRWDARMHQTQTTLQMSGQHMRILQVAFSMLPLLAGVPM